MAKIKVIGTKYPQTTNPLLTENDFANTNALFNIGNFTINKNITTRVVKDYSDNLTTFSQPVTLELLNVTDFETIKTITKVTDEINLNFDKQNLNNYAYYGSLLERTKSSIQNIIDKFPASLYISNTNNGTFYTTLVNYNYDKYTDTTTFNIPSFLVINIFGLTYTNNSTELTKYDDLKNLNLSYNKYSLLRLDNNKEYKLTNFIGTYNNQTGFINVTTKGNPYPEALTSNTISVSFHLKPQKQYYDLFYNNLDNFEKLLLNTDNDPKYTIKIKVPFETEDEKISFSEKSFTWNTSDGYNIDIDTPIFQRYYDSLISLGIAYDKFKTDIIYRMFLTPSVKDNDLTDDFKSQQFSRIYGRELDEIKSFIDGLTYINTISYNKTDNMPDILVKNFAKTLGWKTFNIIETEDLFASIFDNATSENATSLESSTDLDIELWRRILMNTAWLFKSKGTRKALESILAFIGSPDGLININEHIYLVNGKINVETVNLDSIFPLNLQLTRLPYDSEGYPIASDEISSFYFQKAGNTDGGQEYIDIYRNLGFDVTKTIDNKKSWVYSESGGSRYDDFNHNESNYNFNNSKLILNTKEIDIIFDPINLIELDVYNFNKNYNYPVSDVGRPLPYPVRDSNKFSVSALTFSEYTFEIYSRFINVQNRKTSSNGRGGGYPSLYKLYYDYLNNSFNDIGIQSNKYTLGKVLNYIKLFQNYIVKFIDQVVPATVIYNGTGLSIRNSVFTPQKFVYKRGIDEGSEFKLKQPSQLESNVILNNIDSKIILPYESTTRIYESEGNYTYTTNGGDFNPNDIFLNIKTGLKPKDRWESKVFTYDVPGYTMSGATKIETGTTSYDYIYYYDNISTGKTLTFSFTSNTNSLSSQTLDNNFIYKIFPFNYDDNIFTNQDIFTNNFGYLSFSGGNTTITDIIDKNYLSGDTEYLIKGFNSFYLPTPTANTLSFNSLLDMYGTYNKFIYPVSGPFYPRNFDYTNYSGYTGTTFSCEEDYNSLNLPYKSYDKVYDWYFISLSNPITPSLNLIGEEVITPSNPVYIYENLIPNISNEILLTYTPIGDLQVTYNGISLIKNIEYTLNNTTIFGLQNRIYTLIPTYDPTVDIINVAYLAQGNSFSLENDTYTVSTIPSGTTETLPFKVLYNTSNNLYEFYLDNNVSGDTNNVQITYNGISLTPISDYQLSNLNKRKVVFPNITIESGDTINAYYVTSYNIAPTVVNITTNPYTFNWSISNPINNQNGYFSLEFSEQSDINFTGITTSATTNYVDSQSNYSIIADFSVSPFNSLIGGNLYNVRVRSIKEFIALNGESYTTSSISSNKIVKIPT